ncbi:Chromosomal replication initiator, DnaA C-terminal [uncultured Caudovirales phage]|uniref:Chromosomal replication initiator, DnaA C-terminal n=1 Tax=uncultured Caudovirales phage TaxID=2100421 RepID=A0A6J5KZI7_9CAUD|nr:Chromosomal replication initiator, DnaA C-terminal [uncultured Caudovirales phage]
MDPAKILQAVCEEYGIEKADLRLKRGIRQTRAIVEAKQVASYLLWKFCPVNREFIYVLLDYTTPSSVTKNIEHVNKVASVDKQYRAIIIRLETRIESSVIRAKKQLIKDVSQLEIF